MSRAAGSSAANASRPVWTEQPVTTISAPGFARRARRTAARDLASASAVTVHVLTRTRSAGVVAADDGHAPRAEQPCGRIDLGLVDLAAEVDDRRPARRPLGRGVAHAAHGAHQKSGLVLIRNPIVPTSPAMRYDT